MDQGFLISGKIFLLFFFFFFECLLLLCIGLIGILVDFENEMRMMILHPYALLVTRFGAFYAKVGMIIALLLN
jgi:hypothetical protein